MTAFIIIYLFYVFFYFIIIYFTFFIYFTLLVVRSFHLVSGRESREIWKALLLFIIELCILDGADQMKKNVFGYAFFAIVWSLLVNKIQTWDRKIHEIYAACMHT